MGDPTSRYPAEFKQGVPAVLLGRITAADGTGAATGKSGEGNYIKQADIETISCKVFDMKLNTSTTQTIDKTAIMDVPSSSNVLWTQDGSYNFEFTVPGSAFPNDHNYVVQVKMVTTGGANLYPEWQGNAATTLS